MTRTRALLFVVIAFIATLAFGQTYVRPSKGAPVPAFAGYDAGITLSVAAPVVPTYLGTQYEWTAFETVRVRIQARSGTNAYGRSCLSKVLQYDLTGVSTILSFRLIYVEGGTYPEYPNTRWILRAYDAPSPGLVNFHQMTSVNSEMDLSAFLGCAVDIILIPIPFAVVAERRDADAGLVGAPVGSPFQCPRVYQNTYLMDGGIIVMGTAPTERFYTIICNSKDNTSGNLRCRADDAGVVSMSAGTIGDVLGVGDCINYSNPVGSASNGRRIHCIGGSIYATTFECSP